MKFKSLGALFRKGLTCKKNIKRDLVIVLVLLLFASGFFIGNNLDRSKNLNRIGSEPVLTEQAPSVELVSEEKAVRAITEDFSEIVGSIDTVAWKPYQNLWYGFSLAYPTDWLAPVAESAKAPAKWETRYKFRLKDATDKPYLGFDVIIYNVAKTKQLSDTEEFPLIKSEELKSQERCQNLEGHDIEEHGYPIELMYVPQSDECYNEALFFSLTREQYIYNLVPVFKPELSNNYDRRVYIKETFPEIYAVASKVQLIDIKRPKPAPRKPKITAPMPVSYKVENGRLVCAKKKDDPSYSDKTKKKHLDMECCLDPDEYPNPHCYYPPGKYGKYLK